MGSEESDMTEGLTLSLLFFFFFFHFTAKPKRKCGSGTLPAGERAQDLLENEVDNEERDSKGSR